MQALEIPDGTGWEEPYHWVCFNDDCSYFQQGWEHLERNYNQHKSYRHRVNPRTGKASPIPVWSASAMRNLIIEVDAEDAPSSEGDGEG